MDHREPPTTLWGTLRQIGPGLIITANIVGTGELILTTRLGAQTGFTMLWFIIFSCLIKVFVQIEIGRYTISEGISSLQALNRLPGPRAVVSWILWLWTVMFVCTLFQTTGMIVGIADLFAEQKNATRHAIWAVVAAASCAILLVGGRYSWVEKLSTIMVVLFTGCTLFAVIALQWTPYRITGANILDGFSFRLPDSFTVAFAAFGSTGVGASELLYYPYWCMEKGYAKYVGPRDDSEAWIRRARGWLRVMKVDAFCSLVVYTTATVAFYLLGAAILHRRGEQVTDTTLVSSLSQMYLQTFGTWGLWIFLVGASVVLYSTLFVATASNARLLADGGSIWKVLRFPTPESRQRVVRLACVLLPALMLILYFLWRKPVYLVTVGSVAQGTMYPFLGFAALYFRYRGTHPALRPGRMETFLLWLSFAALAIVGLYQIVDKLGLLAANK